MKRYGKYLAVCAMMFSLMLSVKTLASVEFLYANVDNMNVYEEKSRDSKVLKTVKGGTQMLVDEEGGDWWGVLMLDPSGEGQIMGWVAGSDMALAMPSQYCDHQWTEWTILNEPTCTETGMMIRSCPICGVGEGKDTDKLGHSFGNWTVSQPASCTQEGKRVRTCSRCGKQESESIAKEPHRFNEWTVTREPSCTQEGERVHTCTVCGMQEKQVMEKLPHTFRDWTIIAGPTCTKEGKRTHTCAVCGYVENEVIAMLPHEYEWKITTETTDHSSGIREQVCKVCGHTGEQESFDPEGTLRRGDRSDEVKVMLEVKNDMAGVIIDRFGKDVIIAPVDSERFRVSVNVSLSNQFLGWIMAVGDGVKIVGPDKVVEKMKEEIVRLCGQYGI